MRSHIKQNHYRYQRRRGSISLFAAAILIPFLFFLFSLSLDVSKYYQVQAEAQHALDNAALAGGHHLPFVSSAEHAVWSILPSQIKSHTSATITSNSIDLSYSDSVDGIFSRYFGVNVSPHVFAHSKTESVPLQAMILLDTSSNVVVSESSSSSIGQIVGLPSIDTNRCFNSRYTALKKAAVGIYEYVSANSSNAVGVGFFPGHYSINPRSGNIEGDSDLDLARAPRTPASMKQSGTDLQIRFHAYDSNSAKDVWCAALSESPSASIDQRVPSSTLSRISNSNKLVVPSEHSAGWDINLSEETDFQTREVIWAKAAHDPVPLDTVSSITKSLSALLSTSSEDSLFKILPRRILLVASATTPTIGALSVDSAEVRNALTNTIQANLDEQRGFEIWYVLFGNNSLAPNLQTLFDEIHEQNKLFTGIVFPSNSPADLEFNKIPEISRRTKQMALVQ